MNTRRALAGALSVGLATATIAAHAAAASRAACAGDALKARVHDAAARREATLTGLAVTMAAAPDSYGLNRAQATALGAARSSVVAADGRAQSTCFPTLAAFRAAVVPVFDGARVYALRLPQTKEIEAADRMATAVGGLERVAAQLDAHVQPGTRAATALGAMSDDLRIARKLLGTPPATPAALRAVAALTPAGDTAAADLALRRERSNLIDALAALRGAQLGATVTVRALRG